MTPRCTNLALLPLLAVLAVAACAERPEPRAPVNTAFTCQDGQSPVVRVFQDDRATIRLDDGRVVELAREPAASGERYGGDGLTFWQKGRDATLEVGGRSTDCKRTPG
jgi:membrane-bound inhibitor of C-type lysozyme